MSFFRKKSVFALLFVGFLMLLFYSNHWLGKLMYPIYYKEQIDNYAIQYQIDPLLTASIIRVESNYQPEHVSSKGALGLMQIMPQTALWIVEQAGFDYIVESDLLEENINLKLGSWFIAWLYHSFKFTTTELSADEMAVLTAAYNAGPGNVAKWLADDAWDGTFATINSIPYGETRHYIQRVMYYYNKYHKYYGHQ